MPNKDELTAEYLRQRLDYSPDTGELRWKSKPEITPQDRLWNARLAGQLAGYVTDGYRKVRFGRRWHLAHRLIWRLVTGECPELIDHRNGDGSDNRWDNLRAASPSENCRNRGLRRDSESGLKGVCERTAGVWRARIQIDGKRHNLGQFSTPEEAHAAYCAKAQELHGEFYNPGS